MKPIDTIRRDTEELSNWVEVGDMEPLLKRIDQALLELELERARFQHFAGIVRTWALTNESATILDALIQLDIQTLPKETVEFLREQTRSRQVLDDVCEKYRQARLAYEVALALDDSQKRYDATRGLDQAQEGLGEAAYAWAVVLGTGKLLGGLEPRKPQR